MEYKYKVSVIVPIYNVEKYLRRAVDSLLAQTLKEIEIILVDDGSPDNCGTIVDEYAEKYDNIVAVHKENGGSSETRNYGLEIAKGEYIGFIDADDYTSSDMFELMYKQIENKTDLVICNFEEIFVGGHKRDVIVDLPEQGNREEIVNALAFGNLGGYVWNKLFKNTVINENKIRFPLEIPLGEDTVFCCEYIRYISSFSVVNKCLYHYIRNDSSICAKYHKKQFEYYHFGNEAKKKLIETLDDNQKEELLKENDKNYLKTCFNVLDQLNAFTNKQKMKSRYEDLKRIASDEEFVELAQKYGLASENKTLAKKSKWVCDKRYFRLFIHENWKQRVVARINYYIK